MRAVSHDNNNGTETVQIFVLKESNKTQEEVKWDETAIKKNRTSRNDDGSSNTKCPKGGRRPKELQPDNEVRTLSKRQEERWGMDF